MNVSRKLSRGLGVGGFAVAILALILTSVACGGNELVDAAQVSGEIVENQAGTDYQTGAANVTEVGSSYLLFNQKLVEGLTTESVDLSDVDQMFWHIFSRLPAEVTVYPSENYYYFILYTDKRQLWGNIRLAAGRRERGVLSFAYFEFRETPYVTEPRITRSKFFTDSDGLLIEELDPLTFNVRYNGKEVVFNLHPLSQEDPKLFPLASDETSIMRTFDESGYQFFLLFNESKNFFNWVLNEEEPFSDVLVPIREDLLVGRKSGFAFWVDKAHGDRKVLIAIRGQSATRNDYYDGPFDQLADNYVDVTNISKFMERAAPSLKGRIDKFGYFTDRDRPSRVSISPYYVYFSGDALDIYFGRLKSEDDPYYFVSRKGLPDRPASTRPASASQP